MRCANSGRIGGTGILGDHGPITAGHGDFVVVGGFLGGGVWVAVEKFH